MKSTTRLALLWTILLVQIFAISCGGEDSDDEDSQQKQDEEDEEETFDDVCSEQQMTTIDGVEIVECLALHDEAPYVRLPEDSDERRFVGLNPDRAVVEFRGGEVALNEDAMELLAPEYEDWDEPRYAYLLYEVELDGEELKSVKPALMFNGEVFLHYNLAGLALEGLISAFDEMEGGAPRFELEPSLPIRVGFGEEIEQREMAPQGGSFRVYQLKGTITNLTEGVLGAGDDCIPALADEPETNPFFEAHTGEVEVIRYANMHTGFDDVIVVDWPTGGDNMGGEDLFARPIDLLRRDEVSGPYHGTPHGTPWSSPTMDVEPVDGGGGPCP